MCAEKDVKPRYKAFDSNNEITDIYKGIAMWRTTYLLQMITPVTFQTLDFIIIYTYVVVRSWLSVNANLSNYYVQSKTTVLQRETTTMEYLLATE